MTIEKNVSPEQRLRALREGIDRKGFVRILEAHSGLSGIIAENAQVQKNGQLIEYDGIWESSPSSTMLNSHKVSIPLGSSAITSASISPWLRRFLLAIHNYSYLVRRGDPTPKGSYPQKNPSSSLLRLAFYFISSVIRLSTRYYPVFVQMAIGGRI